MKRSAIAYYRVSTVRQGRSGLGLEAQQAAVHQYCIANNYTLVKEIQEVRSTRKQRPGLQQALNLCKEIKAALIVAKLDRLGRDVEEIAHNIKLPVEIIVADNPHANRFTIHILAAVAEEQRRTISENTKAALQAAKRRGKELGINGKKLAEKHKRDADAFALKILPVLIELKKQGITGYRAMTKELNNRGIPTFREGCRWHMGSVYNLVIRVNKITNQEETIRHTKNRGASDEFALKLLPVLHELENEGITSYHAIMNELNRRKIPTFVPGRRWHPRNVYNVILRAKRILNERDRK